MSAVRTNFFTNPRARYGFHQRSCSITAVGSCLPERVLTNAEVGKMVGEDESWILALTGIRERRLAGDNEFTSHLASEAARRALRNAGLGGDQIDLIVLATNTPDMHFPATACLVQAKLGAHRAAAFDLRAGGAGFLHALEIGRQFVMTYALERVLVIGAEKLSAVVDWRDCDTCVLFGDGAGAAVLEHFPGTRGVLASCLGSNGDQADLLSMPGGGSRCPASQDSVASGLHFLRMNGRKMFKQAVHAMAHAAREALRQCNLSISQIQCIIPQQSNRRIINAFAERLGASPKQVFMNLATRGNTGAASIPIALDEVVQTRRIQRGDLILLVAFGSGLTWGATVIRW
jgi:3-oxoacyl-[acyl-carrier-protein] synthase-3